MNAEKWGLNYPLLPKLDKLRLLCGSSRLVSYTNGSSNEFSTNSVLRWGREIKTGLKNGICIDTIIKNKSGGSVSYIDIIERIHPGYLHVLYREATKVKGHHSGFKEIEDYMNEKISIPSETRATITLTLKQVNNWFVDNDGKEGSAIDKPLDTVEHCAEEGGWVMKW